MRIQNFLAIVLLTCMIHVVEAQEVIKIYEGKAPDTPSMPLTDQPKHRKAVVACGYQNHVHLYYIYAIQQIA